MYNAQDGAKVYVDGVKRLDTASVSKNGAVAIPMTAGKHNVMVEISHADSGGVPSVAFAFAKAYSCYDLSGDMKITSGDAGILASAIQSTTADKKAYDLNGDGKLNSADQGLLASKYGKTCQ